VSDDVAKQVGRRKCRVEMGRVDVAGHRGEQIDVVPSDDPYQRSGIADL
jgi:hypothetical protein